MAQDYFWQELPFVYRTHEVPDTEKIKKLSTFINNFGYNIHIGSDEVHPKELQKLLTKIEDTPVEGLISRLTLRSMKQANTAWSVWGISDWRPSTTAISHHRSVVIRICRSIGSSRTTCGEE